MLDRVEFVLYFAELAIALEHIFVLALYATARFPTVHLVTMGDSKTGGLKPCEIPNVT